MYERWKVYRRYWQVQVYMSRVTWGGNVPNRYYVLVYCETTTCTCPVSHEGDTCQIGTLYYVLVHCKTSTCTCPVSHGGDTCQIGTLYYVLVHCKTSTCTCPVSHRYTVLCSCLLQNFDLYMSRVT